MTDRELLELAAKAAGQEPSVAGDLWSNARGQLWNPLTDDGDALRLAVKLGLDIMTRGARAGAYAGTEDHGASASAEENPYAATRRAIVRAAAEIGKAMKGEPHADT